MTEIAPTMTALDLSQNPPRAPREALDGLVFLPRSIDKVRAHLPGGNSGAYLIAGLTQTMLDTLGVSLNEFTLAVSAADDDADVVRFLRMHVAQAKIDEWNAFVAVREPRGGNRAEALEAFPWLADRPDLRLALDIIAEDDRQHFAAMK